MPLQIVTMPLDRVISPVRSCINQRRSHRDIGARLAGGDLTKTTGTAQATSKNVFADASRRPTKAIDSLDLENFLQPK